MKRWSFPLLCLALGLLLAFPAKAASGFTDVADGHWSADAVAFCRERALMQGTGGGLFSPDQAVTRAAAITTLWRLDGAAETSASGVFRDVQNGAWYETAVSWAAARGIANGYGGRFGVGDAVTREQLAAFLWRHAGSPAASGDVSYADSGEVSPYAADAVRWVSDAGIMSGVGNRRFAPAGTATRAQLAVVLMNYVRYTEGGGVMPKDARGLSAFDAELIAFLEREGYLRENYMVSPTSFRAALALALSGADSETKAELIHAMGFETMDEVNGWYDSVRACIDGFAEDLEAARQAFELEKQYLPDGAKAPDRAFSIANSVWHNADGVGTMEPAYIQYVNEHYGASAADVPAAKLTDAVNDWCARETHGLIPRIADDLSDVDSVLVNALYLRTSWLHAFSKWATAADDFVTIDGARVQKEFMNRQDSFLYYEDADSKLVSLPMEGGVSAVFVLGNAGSLREKLSRASYEEVVVKLPKFELETSLERRELVNFLQERGARRAFSPVPGEADFSVMCRDADWFISDVIQKSKLKVDEDGIEAAAVTAIMVKATSAIIVDPPKPKEFIADRPFSFYLIAGSGDARELLFCGQLVR